MEDKKSRSKGTCVINMQGDEPHYTRNLVRALILDTQTKAGLAFIEKKEYFHRAFRKDP